MCYHPCPRLFPGSSSSKEELSFFVCFQQITPSIVCPALRAFTSKTVCLAVAMCDLTSLHSRCLSVHCRTKKEALFLLWRSEAFVCPCKTQSEVQSLVSSAFFFFLTSFQESCYRNCPAKTYSVEEEMTCVPCDDNCVSCDQHECYWCETDLFLSGNNQLHWAMDTSFFIEKLKRKKVHTCFCL